MPVGLLRMTPAFSEVGMALANNAASGDYNIEVRGNYFISTPEDHFVTPPNKGSGMW